VISSKKTHFKGDNMSEKKKKTKNNIVSKFSLSPDIKELLIETAKKLKVVIVECSWQKQSIVLDEAVRGKLKLN
jgi:hypothetical protein